MHLPGGLRTGAIVSRDERAAKNARWYLVDRDGVRKIGWGDLAYADLERLHDDLDDRAFVAVEEAPLGTRDRTDEPWGRYDEPDPRPGLSIDEVSDKALYAVIPEGGVAIIGRTFRTGEIVELSKGRHVRALNASDLCAILRAIACHR